MKDKLNNFRRLMENIFRKDSPRFYGVNYDRWKEKMKTHFLYVGSSYWILTKSGNMIMEEEKLEECSEAESELFMCNMRARKALLSDLLENEYSQVKLLQTSPEI